jgi:hypothetical protein
MRPPPTSSDRFLPYGFREALILLPPAVPRGQLLLATVTGPAACLAVAITAPPAAGAPVFLAVCMVCVLALAHALRARVPPSCCMLAAAGDWWLVVRGDSVVRARLLHSWGARWGWMLGLEWAECATGCRQTLWLLRADVDPVTWRRLRVRLLIA